MSAATSFAYDLDSVLPFAQSLIVGLSRSEDMRAIGLRKRGELVAAVVYEGFNGRNMWAHIAGLPGSLWMTRTFLRLMFAYPFLGCGVERVSCYVEDGNVDSRRLAEHFGFTAEARLRGAAADGGDVLIYVMWRNDCRFIKQGKHHALAFNRI